MDPAVLNQGIELFRSQGPVFWGAIVAIAAGLTLLVVSILVYVKSRLKNRSLKRPNSTKRSKKNLRAATPAAASEQGSPESAAWMTAQASASSFDGAAGEALLARLRDTVLRLESLQTSLNNQISLGDDSRLKQAPPAVEYIFKKGSG